MNTERAWQELTATEKQTIHLICQAIALNYDLRAADLLKREDFDTLRKFVGLPKSGTA